jgi:hypothetical protein
LIVNGLPPISTCAEPVFLYFRNAVLQKARDVLRRGGRADGGDGFDFLYLARREKTRRAAERVTDDDGSEPGNCF